MFKYDKAVGKPTPEMKYGVHERWAAYALKER
jgi:hypothetical protein